jgi:hypothetical protein
MVLAMVLGGPFGMMGVPIMLWLAGSLVLGWYIFVHPGTSETSATGRRRGTITNGN